MAVTIEKGEGNYIMVSFSYGYDKVSAIKKIEDSRWDEMKKAWIVPNTKKALDAIRDLDNVDSDNIFLFGASQGGLVSVLLADEYEEIIKGVLLLFPALCIADNWNEKFPTLEGVPDEQDFWGVTLGRVFVESIHGYNVFEHIGKYHKNVLIFYGDKDPIVPIEYAERASKLYPHARFEVFPGEGHGFSEAGNKKVAEMTYEFIKANL